MSASRATVREAIATPRVSPRLLAAGGVGVAWASLACWLGLGLTARIRDWGVMTDELLYVRLARSVAERHSPLPVVHGVSIDVINQLYPVLLAPFYGSMSAPAAFHGAHVLNAPLMASAVFPAYLLAREVVSRRWALSVAVLSVVTPWIVLAGFLMTEVVAYPAFLWAMLGIVHAVRRGGTRADVLATAGIVLAVLARVQMLVLGVVLVAAVLVHEVGFAAAAAPRGRRTAALRPALSSALRRHRALSALTVAALVVTAAAAVLGTLSRALGVYAPALRNGSLLPGWFVQATAAHLDSVAIGCGLLPLVLGGGWMLSTLTAPSGRAAHAFAVSSLLATLALAFQAASFDLRFGGREAVRDRYVFYVVPLLLAGTAALLSGTRRPGIAAVALTGLFAASVHWLALPTVHGLWVDAPPRVLDDVLERESGQLSTTGFVAVAGALLGLVAVASLRLLPRRVAVPLVMAFVAGYASFATARVVDHTIGSASVSGRGLSAPPGVVLDWVDRVLPPDATAAIVPYPTSPDFAQTAVLWWDVEFWNRSVERAFSASDGDFRYTPFPVQRLAPDPRTGTVPGTANAPAYVVAAKSDARFQLAYSRWVGTNYGLDILAVPRPYRVRWLTRGLQPDGWTRPGSTATIRAFTPTRRRQLLRVSVTLSPASGGSGYVVAADGRALRGRVRAGADRTASLDVCARNGSFADVAVGSTTSALAPGIPRTFAAPAARRVGVLVSRVAAVPTGRSC
jgi:hypothetical protein